MLRFKTLKKIIRFILFVTLLTILTTTYFELYTNKYPDFQVKFTYSWQKRIDMLPKDVKIAGGIDHVLLAQDATTPSRIPISTEKATQRLTVKTINDGLTIKGNKFLLNGEEFRILGGTLHYFRVVKEYWADRLLKIKAAGLNTVVFPIAWCFHEPRRDRFEFDTLIEFLDVIKKFNLFAIVQIGPYIGQGLDWGGLPAWLLYPNIKHQIRSSNSSFLEPVRNYLHRLLDHLYSFGYRNFNGPIIAYQIEHDFGDYIRDDTYLNFLTIQLRKKAITELIFLADKADTFYRDTELHVPQTVKCLLINSLHDSISETILKAYGINSTQPILIMSFPTARHEIWSDKHVAVNLNEMSARLKRCLLLDASIVFDPFIGGTNFAFSSGSLNNSLIGGYLVHELTSYFEDAPVKESGEYEEKYFIIRSILKDMQLTKNDWKEFPTPPLIVPARGYGVLKTEFAFNYSQIIDFMDKYSISKRNICPMEALNINDENGQDYGYIIYRTKFIRGKELSFVGSLHDLGWIIINNKTIQKVNNSITYDDKTIKMDKIQLIKSNNLDIFVENCGRVYAPTRLNDQRKGLRGRVLISNVQLTGFKIISLDFKAKFTNQIEQLDWQVFLNPKQEIDSPTMFKFSLEINNKPHDTYLSMNRWNKGLVLINGINIGRYWNRGPQRRLFVPAPLLKTGINIVVVFELNKQHSSITFYDSYT